MSLRSLEIQTRIAELNTEVEGGQLADDVLRAKEREIIQLGQQYRSALLDEHNQADELFGTAQESAPISELVRRASAGAEFGPAFDAVLNRRVVGGAVAELQQERNLPSHLLPTELFMVENRVEHRAALTGLAGSPSQPQAFRPYIFPQSLAQFMGWDLPIVAYGTPAYPVVTTPVTMHTPAEGADASETTGVIGADALTPQRVEGSLRYSREDAARFAMLGDAVRGHVSAAYTSAVDQRCLTDTTAGLLSITEPTDPAGQTDFDDYVGAVVGGLGKYAGSPADVRMLIGSKTAAHAVTRYKTNNSPTSSYQAMIDLLGGNLRVAAGIPAPAANDQAAFSVGGIGAPHAVSPQWQGVEVVVDPYTASVQGEVIVTIIGMAALKILRTDAYTRHRFQLVA